MEAMQPRICIQPQSRRSPRYYITIIIRAPSRVFQFQDSQHSFQDCMDYILPGLHWKRFTTPCRIAYTAPSTAVAFPYLTAYLQVFCLFIFFGQIAFLLVLAGPCYISSFDELTADGIKNTWIGEVSLLFLGPSFVSTIYSPSPLKSRIIYSQHFKFCWIWDFQKAQSKVSKRNLLAGYYSKNYLSSSRGSGSSSSRKHYSVKINLGLLRNSRTKDELKIPL